MAIILSNLVGDIGTNWVIRNKYFRFKDKKEKAVYISSLLLISCFLKGLVAIILFGFQYSIFPHIFNTWTNYYYLLLDIQIIVFLLSVTNNLVTPVLILEERTNDYMTLTMGTFIITTGVSLLLLLKYKSGLVSLFYGDLAGGIYFTALSIYFLRDQLILGFDRNVIRDVIKIGLPAVPKNMFAQIQSNINGYYLAMFLGPGALGIFQKSEFLPTSFNSLQKAFGNTISASNIERITKTGEDLQTGKLTLLFTYFLSIVLIITVYFMKDIFILMGVNSSFWVCAIYAPLYATSILFTQFSIMFVNNILVSGKTYLFTIRSIVTGIVSILLSVFLVPRFGIIGAISTVILSSLMSICLEIYVSEVLLSYKTKINYWAWIFILICTIFASSINIWHQVESFTLKISIIFGYIILIGIIDKLFVKAISWHSFRYRAV